MIPFLRPSPTLTQQEVERSLSLMVWESVASGAMYSLGSGGFMAAYALALGANNLQVGILAALPFITQIMQLPSILAVERLRLRKALGMPALCASHLCWLPIGAVPFLLDTPGAAAVSVVIGMLALRGLFSSLWGTSWTSWMRDLIPRNILGSYYGRRLAIVTGTTAILGLAASQFVSWWEGTSTPEDAILAYSFLLIGGVFTLGIVSPLLASRASEPQMPAAQETGRSVVAMLSEPLRDRNFSQLVRFLFAWSLASNLAIPFFAVYMLSELELPLSAVIAFTVLSQITNVLFVRVWGPMSDRVGSKTVLSLSASLYLLVILGWIFTAYPDRHSLTVPLLIVLHMFAGVAAAGVTLTLSTITLKVAPEGKATPFMGIANISTSVGAGIGAIAGGLMADFFANSSLSLDLNWTSATRVVDLSALSLGGFDFLFAAAFVLGLLSLNLLVALREEGELSRDAALGELRMPAGQAMQAVSSVPGLAAVSAFSYGYLRRVPGADVALGVTAYQLAASTQAAARSAGRSRTLAGDVARNVSGALEGALRDVEGTAEHGLELARHATRGAIQAGDEFTDRMGSVARGAVLGTLRGLAEMEVPVDEALRGAGYGAVQGAVEAGEDAAEAAVQAVEAARQASHELGLDSDDAEAAIAEGLLEAAADSGEDVLAVVRRVLDGSPS